MTRAGFYVGITLFLAWGTTTFCLGLEAERAIEHQEGEFHAWKMHCQGSGGTVVHAANSYSCAKGSSRRAGT